MSDNKMPDKVFIYRERDNNEWGWGDDLHIPIDPKLYIRADRIEKLIEKWKDDKEHGHSSIPVDLLVEDLQNLIDKGREN